MVQLSKLESLFLLLGIKWLLRILRLKRHRLLVWRQRVLLIIRVRIVLRLWRSLILQAIIIVHYLRLLLLISIVRLCSSCLLVSNASPLSSSGFIHSTWSIPIIISFYFPKSFPASLFPAYLCGIFIILSTSFHKFLRRHLNFYAFYLFFSCCWR
jgi:hypothetical protein